MSTFDLNNLKEQVQTILETANTTTATHDLSDGLTFRIKRVLQLNPERVSIQPTWLPFVTCYIESKDVISEDMVGAQSSAKRLSEVSLKVLGAVYNATISDFNQDPADDEIETLMGNVETVLADAATLNGTVLWHQPTTVQFHNENLDESAHLRYGEMDITCMVLQ